MVETVLALLTGVMVLCTAALALLSAIQTLRTRRQLKEIHVLVNSRMDEMVTRVKQLEATLRHAGVSVPSPKGRAHE